MYIGVSLQILSSLWCVLTGGLHDYSLLVLARFLLALGAGFGLKMTFTLVNENFVMEVATQKISYLMLAFAITPALRIALGGLLNTYFGWTSCFYAGAVHGLVLLVLVTRLPETQIKCDPSALKIKHLIHAYGAQFKNLKLITSAC